MDTPNSSDASLVFIHRFVLCFRVGEPTFQDRAFFFKVWVKIRLKYAKRPQLPLLFAKFPATRESGKLFYLRLVNEKSRRGEIFLSKGIT